MQDRSRSRFQANRECFNTPNVLEHSLENRETVECISQFAMLLGLVRFGIANLWIFVDSKTGYARQWTRPLDGAGDCSGIANLTSAPS